MRDDTGHNPPLNKLVRSEKRNLDKLGGLWKCFLTGIQEPNRDPPR